MAQINLSVQEIANRLAELVGAGQFQAAQDELFANDAVSIEFPDANGNLPTAKGSDALTEKKKQFQAAVESVQGLQVSAPLVQGNAIALGLVLDFTAKGGGAQRLAEICVYQVKDGKIISEQFFA